MPRWITASALCFLLVAATIALLAFTAAWTPEGQLRCFADIAHSQFPKWLGCAIATHEALAGSLIAAGGALFGAWLAFGGLQDQIGLARKNEREAKRLAIGDLRLNENAARAPDGIGETVTTLIGRLNTLADSLYEETKNLNADMRTPKLRTREQEVVGLLEALRHLDKKLQEQNDIYAQKYKDARAERIE